jgi:hypothetical protein
MGGFGSGRWAQKGTQPTVDTVRRLDVRILRQRCQLWPGARGTLYWANEMLDFIVRADHLLLYSRTTESREAVGPVTIWLDWTPCHYGGHRLWFLCPRCARRVAALCRMGGWWRCRHCARLRYASQHQTYGARMVAQARKIRRRVGAGFNLTLPLLLWDKPKGMHWRTFERLIARDERYRQAAFWALVHNLPEG